MTDATAPSSTRDRILQSTLEQFAERGIAQTGMEDIARAAGLTRATLYYHFAGKRELVLEVLIRRSEYLHQRIRDELAYQAATAELVILANVRAVELAAADPIARLLAAPGNEHLTAELLESERMLPVHRAFWYPLLQAATDAGELRAGIDFDELIAWMVFLQFSMFALGDGFGYLEGDRLRTTWQTFLLPALRPA